MTALLLKEGEIRHSVREPEVIMKCMQAEGTSIDNEGGEIPLDMFILTNNFPKYHYVIIDRVIENYSYLEHPYCLVYLVTHSLDYDNVKVTSDFYNDSTINLDKSYITRDKFLIHVDNFSGKVFGHFDMQKLRTALEY